MVSPLVSSGQHLSLNAFYSNLKPQTKINTWQVAGNSQVERKGGCQADEMLMLNLIQSNASLLVIISRERREGKTIDIY